MLQPSSTRALAFAAALAALPAARADVLEVRDRGRMTADVVSESDAELRLKGAGGWTIVVPRDRVLARTRQQGGQVELVAADRFEDHGAEHESRGRHAAAFEAYREALERTLDAAAVSAVTPELATARAEVYLRRMHQFAGQAALSEEAVAAFTAVAEDRRAPALVRDWALTWRAPHLAALGRFDLARGDDLALGVITSWFVVGPFDNERGTGFQRAFGPETQGFDPAASFEGKKNLVSWRALPVVAPRGMVDLNALMRPADQGAAYALTYLFAEEATSVALRIGSDEALKVWVNRGLVHQRDARRPVRSDQDVVGVALGAGWNEVLVKVCDQTGEWGLRVRVSAPRGGPASKVRGATLPEIASRPAPATVAPAAVADAKALAWSGGIAALESAVQASKDDWRAHAHLGYLRWSLRAEDEGKHDDRDAVQAACKLRPQDPHLLVLLAATQAISAEFSVNKEENPRRQSLERAIALDPGHAEARYQLAQYYAYNLGAPLQARDLLAPVAGPDGVHLGARLMALDLEGPRGLTPLVEGELNRLMAEAEGRAQREEARGFPEALLRRAIAQADGRGDQPRVRDLYDLVLQNDQSDVQALVAQARSWRGAGHEDLTDALLRRAIEVSPFRLDLRFELAQLLESRGDLPAAAAALSEAIEVCPDEPALVEALGHLQERQGQATQADAQFDRALQLDPNRVDLRDYLEFRARNSETTAPFEAAWWVDAAPLVVEAKKTPLDPRRTHRYLLKQTIARVNPDGTTSEATQEVIRIENDVGARELAAYGTVYASDQRIRFQLARIHRANGGTEDAPVGSGRGRAGGEFTQYLRFGVRFPPLRPGDVVEVRYRTDDLQQGFFGDYYGHTAEFQAAQAIDWARYVLIAPRARQFFIHKRGVADAAERRTQDATTQTFVWEVKGVTPLEQEPMQPWAKELVPQVQVSTFGDWNAFARWYWGLVKNQHEADDAIRAKVRELCEGATTDEERIRRIYHYVVTDIRYNASWEFGVHGFKPYNATQIYSRKFGDCKDKATLINTMLREVGIASYPVLIFGEDGRGHEDISLPLMGHFNHCISWVDFGEGGIFLDGTAEHHPYGTLPTMDYGATVVVITPDAGVVREIPFRGPEANGVREEHRVKLRDDGGATVTSVIEGRGTFEVVLRSWMLTEGRRKELLEPIIGRAYTGAQVTAVRASDVRDLNQPVRVEIDAELPRVVGQTAGGQVEVREMRSWLFDQMYLGGQRISALAADSTRQRDVVLQVPSGVEETVTYELPAGHSVQSMPAAVKLESDLGVYERTYALEGGKLVARRVLKLKTNRVPVARYEEFRRFVSSIEQAEAERPVLRRGGADQ